MSQSTRTGATVVMTGGLPLPAPRAHEEAVKGAAIGGGLGAIVGALLMFPPLGIALAAAAGAFVGTAAGSESDQKA